MKMINKWLSVLVGLAVGSGIVIYPVFVWLFWEIP